MKVLICEKQEILLNAIELRLTRKGFELITTTDGQQALLLIKEKKPDILVIDLEFISPAPEKIIQKIKLEWKSDLPIIIIAPLEEEERIIDAIKMGVADFILKPFKPKELLMRIQIVLESQKVELGQNG